MSTMKHVFFGGIGFCITFATLLVVVIGFGNHATAIEKSTDGEKNEGPAHNFPPTAFDYAKLVEPQLGVPPKIDLSAGVELPLYVDGVQSQGELGYSCDNPSRIGKGCVSGSVVQRYEGQTAEGEPLPDVVWVSFGRNASTVHRGKTYVLGSVQMIGYDMETGATAFFESSDAIDPWADVDPETHRLQGEMPWIDNPEEFNKAFRTPGMIQCVECHQNDPFIHNDFIDAAKLPGTDEPVVPEISTKSMNKEFDLPYYVIGGEEWDMRTIHIEGNKCMDCHRIGMGTVKLFGRYGWEPDDHMPPNDPGSLAEDFQELVDCWENGPENTPGCDWVIPPTGEDLGRVVGDDYAHKARFNIPGNEALAAPGILGGGKSSKKDRNDKEAKGKSTLNKTKSSKDQGENPFGEMSREELIEAMKAKGMTEKEIAEFLISLDEGKK